jgi:hypothetical protein
MMSVCLPRFAFTLLSSTPRTYEQLFFLDIRLPCCPSAAASRNVYSADGRAGILYCLSFGSRRPKHVLLGIQPHSRPGPQGLGQQESPLSMWCGEKDAWHLGPLNLKGMLGPEQGAESKQGPAERI